MISPTKKEYNEFHIPDENTRDYEIESSKRKLMLVPIEYGRKRILIRDHVYASVSTKYRSLTICTNAIDAMGMNKGWYKMAYDSGNNIIAWRIAHELDQYQMEDKAWKAISIAPSTKMITIGIGRILDTFQGLKKGFTYKSEIKKYKDPKSILDNELYYYIELTNV